MGVDFDAWQDGAGRAILAKRADGSYACSVGGVVLSIPRQVGKTFLIGAIVFALCILKPGMKVLWTAHHSDTATETFQSLVGFSLRKKVRPHVAKRLMDAMTITFRNGSQIMFGARERGFGRGMTSVGLLVFDEAQILTERASSDMVPTTNTVPDALVLYAGTPPRPSDPSEVFSNRRKEALSGESDDLVYVEFSADRGANPLDKRQWAKANPSYPSRTNDTAMLRMHKNLTADSFLREALGIWDENVAVDVPVVLAEQWAALAIGDPPASGDVAYGVKFSADGASVALAVAMRTEAGVHVEGVQHRPMLDGTDWLVDWLKARVKVGMSVVVDGKSGAGALVTALADAKVPTRWVRLLTVDEVITAHSMILDAVRGGRLSHFGAEAGRDALSVSVASSGRRPIGKAGGWGVRSINGGDCALFESVVLAHFAASTAPKKRDRTGQVRVLA